MKIDIWSDFICPFCYIGKRQLDNALEQFSHRDNVEIIYRSYELEPDATAEAGQSFKEHLAETKGMSLEQVDRMNDNVKKQAAEAGLTYHFDTMQFTNTFDAHRLAIFASEKGRGEQMVERLFRAYFTDSELISNYDTLIKLADEAGLQKEDAAAVLNSDIYGEEVRSDENQAAQLGAEGVPFFVFNEKYAISGAESQDVFAEVLEKVWEEEQKGPGLQSLNSNKSQTTYCTDDGCYVEEEE